MGGQVLFSGNYEIVKGADAWRRVWVRHEPGAGWDMLVNGLPVPPYTWNKLKALGVVEHCAITYPNGRKYGVPYAATKAAEFSFCAPNIVGLENVMPGYTLQTTDTRDDSGEVYNFLLALPEEGMELVPVTKDIQKPKLVISSGQWSLLSDHDTVKPFARIIDDATVLAWAEAFFYTRTDAKIEVVRPHITKITTSSRKR